MRRLHILLPLAFLAAGGAAAAAPVPPDVQKAIDAQYALTCGLVLDPSDAKVDAFGSVMSPDFVMTDLTGMQHKKPDVIAIAKQQLTTFKATSCENTDESLTAGPQNTVVVVSDQTINGTIVAQGASHPFTAQNKAQDTWALSNGKWLLSASKALHTTVLVDGKVVQDVGT